MILSDNFKPNLKFTIEQKYYAKHLFLFIINKYLRLTLKKTVEKINCLCKKLNCTEYG